MIYADMSFGYMFALATVITFAGIGFAGSAVFLFRMFKAAGLIRPRDAEYMEDDELVFHGWEDEDLMPVPVERKTAPERKRVPVQYVNIFDDV